MEQNNLYLVAENEETKILIGQLTHDLLTARANLRIEARTSKSLNAHIKTLEERIAELEAYAEGQKATIEQKTKQVLTMANRHSTDVEFNQRTAALFNTWLSCPDSIEAQQVEEASIEFKGESVQWPKRDTIKNFIKSGTKQKALESLHFDRLLLGKSVPNLSLDQHYVDHYSRAYLVFLLFLNFTRNFNLKSEEQ